MSIIVIRKLMKSYQNECLETKVLKGIDMEVKKGEFIGIFGKSGSGKSTLLNILGGIDQASSGEIWFNNKPIHTHNQSQLTEWRRENIGIVFQFFQLLSTLTIIENVILPMELAKKYNKKEREIRAMELLEKMEICELAHKYPSSVSGGEQQRAAIARALANDPEIILADEPTGNLDSKTADNVFHFFEKLVQDGKTVLIITHDMNMRSRFMRSYMMSDGQIIKGA